VDRRSGHHVALKVLSTRIWRETALRQRFEAEARLHQRLVHPRVVRMLEQLELEDRPVLVLEWVDGRTLAELLGPDGLPAQRVLELALQLADALSALHVLGVVNRDLKPANVMVDDADRLTLLDLGLARALDESRWPVSGRATTQGTTVGTPDYMSPEQVRGEELSLASDVFSFGSLLVEMLTGRSPFRRATVLETMSAIGAGRRPRSASALGWPRRQLMALARRCMAPDPTDRPEDGRDLLAELRQIRRRRAPRLATVSTLAVVAVLGVVAALVMVLEPSSDEPRLRSPDAADAALARLGPALTVRTETSLAVLRPDGEALITAEQSGLELWQHPLGPGLITRLGTAPGRIGDLAIGPDGRWILLEALDRAGRSWVWEMPASGGAARKVLQGEMPAVDHSGQRLCVVRRRADSGVDLVCGRRNGTEARVVTTLPGGMAPVGLSFVPAQDKARTAPQPGLVVLLTDGVRASRLVLVDLTDGRRHELIRVDGIALPGLAVSALHHAAVWCLRPVARQGSMVVATPLDAGPGQVRVGVVYPGPGWNTRPTLDAGEHRLALAVLEHDSRLELIRVDPDRPDPATGSTRLPGTAGASQPRISPDGSRLLFQSELGHLWMMRLDREPLAGGPSRATGPGPDAVPLQRTGEASFNPGWSPDGRLVVYTAVQDHASRLWIAGVDGGEPEPITPASSSTFQPVWHPDGHHVLMISDRDGVEDLFSVDLRSGQIVRLNHDGAVNPAISPTGELVAFDSPRDGATAILRLSRLDIEQGRLETVWERPILCSARAGGKSRFSPDGRWLAFDVPDGGNGADIVAVRVDGPPTAAPKLLVDLPAGTDVLRWFDWGPDGTLVAALNERTVQSLILDDASTMIERALR